MPALLAIRALYVAVTVKALFVLSATELRYRFVVIHGRITLCASLGNARPSVKLIHLPRQAMHEDMPAPDT